MCLAGGFSAASPFCPAAASGATAPRCWHDTPRAPPSGQTDGTFCGPRRAGRGADARSYAVAEGYKRSPPLCEATEREAHAAEGSVLSADRD